MRRMNLQFNLPTFDDLMTPQTLPMAVGESTVRSMNVLASVQSRIKLKVAAYCRVSTDKEDQKSSIRIQREHFTSVASQHPDWQFVGIYADIVSGTKKEKRPELQRLLKDCSAGKVNLVLIKSVSRFARNTTDLLEMVRSLTARGTDIFFERENIDTRTMDSEFLLTILASLAEDESHSISDNCRWGLQKRFQDGSYRAASAPYGYDLVDGNYAVNETEAEIVKEIFSCYLADATMAAIARNLNERGIPTKRAGQVWKGQEIAPTWTSYTISSILKNVSYTGDQVFQKCYTDRSFRMCRNKGQYPQYHHEGHHPGIIDKETFETVQEKLAANKTDAVPYDRNQKSILSGKLICGCCGANLNRSKNRVGNVYWICRQHRKEPSSCPLPSIKEDDFIRDFQAMMEELHKDDSPIRDYLDTLIQNFNAHPKVSALQSKIRQIDQETDGLRNSRGRVLSIDFHSRQNALERERASLQSDLDAMYDNRIDETEELLLLVHSGSGSFYEYFRHVGSVTVQDRGAFTVMFRCGLELYYDGR